ncbi:MAG: CRISPR-associated endonuclease Cas2 [Desulfobacteraceae bacterium]|nr:CRISPR-associated endonuclease Cas2 [Desulfobacteraceae bacterium]
MMVLVTYDVSMGENGQKRLRHVAKICKDYGQRVQFSVFECDLDPALWTFFKNRLMDAIDPDMDSLRFYHLGTNWKRRVEHIGAKKSRDMDAPLIL